MGFPSTHPPERRRAVEALLRDPQLSIAEISARTGVSYDTIRTWNVRAGWIRPKRKSRRPDPNRWSGERREALARLYREARNDPGDIAEVAGVGRSAGRALFLASGLILRDEAGPEDDPPRRRAAAPEPEPLAPLNAASAADAPTLRAHLRAHVARQIAAFDAALRGEGATVLDSARVLRDLGGLKRLFDDIVASERREAGEGERGASPEPPPDPEALRADIARRYARFISAGDPGCLPGDPAG